MDITIDPKSQTVAGKAQWLYQDDPMSNLDPLLKSQFNGIQWRKLVPCHTWSDGDSILTNQNHGFYIAVDHGHAAFVSWSTPELVALRIELLYKKCPKLQPPLQ